ncbi:MAG TPA: bifunctional [glutamate--ammonia ligase]-adenylyl-L-tyrosine phosphorylase/[glutamate--ammonia-ligase] adenylyltransferase, partial [Steroidobacteraceae bacterium]|nr:bifunctional [glutamate--ammonia ligase]-adenylyl-L-tyrosine phosphorylase/[glutamate--ammonia-ligase] adenylyltransferase [Steroidobacteraceae bacterium]
AGAPGGIDRPVDRWREAGGDPDALPAEFRAALPGVFAASNFVLESAMREPGMLPGLAGSGALGRARAAGEIGSLSSALAAAHGEEPSFMDALRRLRRHELVRIAWRDLAGLATLEETLHELSSLADGAIRAALDFASRALAPRYGMPRSAGGDAQELVVVGMGKLGGGELNFSSDVDLVFLYPEQGDTDGPRSITSEEYFTRLGQSLIRLLDARTAEGFVFRVDMRLRPLGEPGPLAMNFGAFEDYLQQHGRDWERYAWVKARAITGMARYAALHDDVVRPFVYRRYLDYGVYESLREMKAMIAREVERRELQDNVKLGPGGIREIEFIVQSQQLIRGGSDPGLRTPSLLTALPRLAGAKLLPRAAVAELMKAYSFLRRVENRLQMADDAQTHALPEDAAGRARLAASMGFADGSAFAPVLDAERRAVTARFDAVVLGRGAPGHPRPAALFESLWSPEGSLEQVVEDVRRAGLADPEAAARLLLELRQSAYFRRLDGFGRRRLATLLPRVLDAVARVEEGSAGSPGLPVLTRLVRIIEAIGGRTAYLALLNENAQALERLVQACTMGDYLARQVAAHPLLLDELIDARVLETLPDRAQFAEELAARLEHAGTDEELQVDALRHFRRAATFRVAMLDLAGRLPLMQVSDRLTDVAELILERALALAWRHTSAQYGEPRCDSREDARTARVGIAGYGKLGGMELGYASDLDLVFLHDAAGSAQTSGPKVVDNEVFFLRLAQRLVHLLTVHTPAGRLYEVDVRLRPSGKGGLAFTGIDAFEDYQRREAWTFEHQALLHSRWVAGDAALGTAFTSVRRGVLTEAVKLGQLRADVLAMRERMRAEHGRTREGQFDLKHDRGGIADIEFLAQYWVLRHVREHPPLARFADTIRHLESVGSAALIDHRVIDRLVDAYRAFRTAAHHLSLEQLPAVVKAGEFAAEQALVAALWEQVMVAGEDPAPL